MEFKGTAISSRRRDLEEGYGFCRGGVGCGWVRLDELSPSLSAQLIVRLIAPTVYGLGCAWGLLSLRGAVIWRRVTVFVGAVLGAVGKGSLSHSLWDDLLSPSLSAQLIVRLIAPTVYGLGCACLPSI